MEKVFFFDMKGQMTEEQLDHFFREGFVILENVLEKELLDNVVEELEVKVDILAKKLLKAGKINNLHEDKDFYTRSIFLNREFPGN